MLYVVAGKGAEIVHNYILDPSVMPEGVTFVEVKWKKHPKLLYHLMTFLALGVMKRCRWLSGFFLDKKTIEGLRQIKNSPVLIFDEWNVKRQRLLARELKGNRIKVFLWDCVSLFYFDDKRARGYDRKIKRTPFEVYTYSPLDAQRFGYKLVDQVYRPASVADLEDEHEPVDVFYIGADRRRADVTCDILDELKKENISHRFILSRSNRDHVDERLKPYYSDKYIPYAKMLNHVKSAKCLVEMLRAQGCGWTMRTMESLMFDRKLITTNCDIVNAPFYHPDNIYVWGHDKRALREFLDAPYHQVSDEIKRRYHIGNWLAQFA